jgi:hypothetical protein
MGHIIELPPALEFFQGIWVYVIKPLWWLWLLALALGLFPKGLDYFFRHLKKRMSKK